MELKWLCNKNSRQLSLLESQDIITKNHSLEREIGGEGAVLPLGRVGFLILCQDH